MRTSSRAGFVLLEAVVALAIISLVSLGLLQARGQQIRVASQARELLTAQALAEDRLAALRLLDYQNLTQPPDSILAGAFPEPFEDFFWVTTVEVLEDEYDLFGVDVVVTGPAERFLLGTLVHRPRAVLGGGGAGGVEQRLADLQDEVSDLRDRVRGIGGERGGRGDRAGLGGRGGRAGGGDRARGGRGGGGGDRAGGGAGRGGNTRGGATGGAGGAGRPGAGGGPGGGL